MPYLTALLLFPSVALIPGQYPARVLGHSAGWQSHRPLGKGEQARALLAPDAGPCQLQGSALGSSVLAMPGSLPQMAWNVVSALWVTHSTGTNALNQRLLEWEGTPSCPTVKGWIMSPPNSLVEVLTPSSFVCDLI